MPVTEIEFERSVHRGLGRSVLWLKRGEIVPDRDFLLYACTHNLAYDRQCEDNRALYMFAIIQATGEPEFYSQSVMHSLREVSDNQADWDDDERSIYQMFDLVGLLAKSGNAGARQALYAFFMKHIAGPDNSRSEVIVDVDGLDGYLFIVRQWLDYPREEEDHWHEAYLLEAVEKRFGADEVQAFLTQAALTEPAIGAYLAEVREKQTAWHTRQKQMPKPHKPDYAELRQIIFDTDKRLNRPRFWRWGEKMSVADAEQFASELLAETDPKRLERYLHLFHRRAFPLDHTPLLALARSADEAIATTARAALAQVVHPSVRALALELMEADPQPWKGIEMLIKNFCTGDEQAVERVLEKCWDADEMHRLTLDMRHLVEANPQPVFTGALMRLYEEGYCTMCRLGVLELLAKIGPLPPYIVEEDWYDAYDGTRELMAELPPAATAEGAGV